MLIAILISASATIHQIHPLEQLLFFKIRYRSIDGASGWSILPQLIAQFFRDLVDGEGFIRMGFKKRNQLIPLMGLITDHVLHLQYETESQIPRTDFIIHEKRHLSSIFSGGDPIRFVGFPKGPQPLGTLTLLARSSVLYLRARDRHIHPAALRFSLLPGAKGYRAPLPSPPSDTAILYARILLVAFPRSVSNQFHNTWHLQPYNADRCGGRTASGEP